jgi:hypothetical protein
VHAVGQAPDEPEDDEGDPRGAQRDEGGGAGGGEARGDGEEEEGQADGEVRDAVVRPEADRAEGGAGGGVGFDEAGAGGVCGWRGGWGRGGMEPGLDFPIRQTRGERRGRQGPVWWGRFGREVGAWQA